MNSTHIPFTTVVFVNTIYVLFMRQAEMDERRQRLNKVNKVFNCTISQRDCRQPVIDWESEEDSKYYSRSSPATPNLKWIVKLILLYSLVFERWWNGTVTNDLICSSSEEVLCCVRSCLAQGWQFCSSKVDGGLSVCSRFGWLTLSATNLVGLARTDKSMIYKWINYNCKQEWNLLNKTVLIPGYWLDKIRVRILLRYLL